MSAKANRVRKEKAKARRSEALDRRTGAGRVLKDETKTETEGADDVANRQDS